MSSLHLGVYVGAGGSAALYDGRSVLQLFEERALTRTGARTEESLTVATGPGGPSLRSSLCSRSGGATPLPRESIRACLRGAGVGWSELEGVTIVGPDGARERFEAEYAQHQGFSELTQLRSTSAQVALSQLALLEHNLSEGLCLVMSTEQTLNDVSSYALLQVREAVTQELYVQRSAEQLCALQSPVLAYQTLISRARAQLGVTDTADHHPLEWAAQLASSAQTSLPQLKRWFSATPNSFELIVSSYDMWLELLCLERRFRHESAKIGAQDAQLRELWAALIAKAQRELGDALRSVVLYARRDTPELPLIFAGELALDPALSEHITTGPEARYVYISRTCSDAGIAIGAAALGATLSAEPAQLTLRRSLSLNAEGDEELISQSLKQLRPPLSAERLELVELGKRFARRLRRGALIGYFEGPTPLGYAPQLNRLCLIDPSAPRAQLQLNQGLERDPDSPTYLLCPIEQAGHIFEGVSGLSAGVVKRCAPKEKHHAALKATLRGDGRATLLLLDLERDPLLCELCEALSLHFNRLPLLLAAPLTLTSGQRAAYPSDALHALSTGTLDALLMGSYWIESALSPQRPQARPLLGGRRASLETILPVVMRDFLGELESLDQLLFDPGQLSVDWSPELLQRLSRELAPYRAQSQRFERHPLLGPLDGHALQPEGVSFLLNPRGMSKVVDEGGRWPTRLYPWPEAATLLSLMKERRLQEARLSQRLHLPPRELTSLINWGLAELEALGVSADLSWRPPPRVIHVTPSLQGDLLLAPFQDPKLDLREELRPLWVNLMSHGYSEERLSHFRRESAPRALTQQPADLLVRLFWRGEPLSRPTLTALLGEGVMATLIQLGVLIGKEDLRSQLKLDCVAGTLIASDYAQPLSRMGAERLLPSLSAHERGLVRLGLSKRGGRTLDLSETLGGVAITQARISRPIDILVRDPRAYRFTHFNLQLNGVEPASLQLTDELKQISPHLYDQVYTRSNEVLREASAYLKPRGRVIALTEDIGATARTPVNVLHRALGLPLCTRLVSLGDPRLSQGFEGHAGYWAIEHRDELEETTSAWIDPHAASPLHRPLIDFPCTHLHEYLDHYFTPPLSAQELVYPHPSLSLTKRSLLSDQKRFSASNERWESLSELMILDEVYAHLKSLMVQRQQSPVTAMSADLMRLGLMIVKRRLSPQRD